MKTYRNLFDKIISLKNLEFAFKNARKGKTKKDYVILFEANLKESLIQLQKELKLLQKEPIPYVLSAQPQPNNMLIWHFIVEGPEGTPVKIFLQIYFWF